MEKKEIIKQSIMGNLSVAYGRIEKNDVTVSGFQADTKNVVIVDLDKLVEFLAKHLDIKPENLVD